MARSRQRRRIVSRSKPGKARFGGTGRANTRYQTQGNYRLQLTLKRGKKTIVAGNTTVQVRPGARDMSETPQ